MKVKHPFQRGHRYFCSSQKLHGNSKRHRVSFYWGLTIDGLWYNETLKSGERLKSLKKRIPTMALIWKPSNQLKQH